MDEPTLSWWKNLGEGAGAIFSGWFAVNRYSKARRANRDDRIEALERLMREVKRDVGNAVTKLESIEQRQSEAEVNLDDLRRIRRRDNGLMQDLQMAVEMLTRVVKRLETEAR